MKFKISEEIFQKFPGLNIGLISVKDMDNSGESEEVIGLLKEEQKKVKDKFEIEPISDDPKIKAWREAYSSFGAKPKKYKCSVENLYRMILEGIQLKHINKIVDIYNYVSIKNTIPVGGDDVDKVDGGITLTVAKGDEEFKALNSDEVKNPKEGEVVYMDDKEVLCRRWNWRECDKSKMTEETKNAALVVEGLPPVTKEEVEEIINELAELVTKYCGGETQTFIVDKDNSEVEF